MKEPDGHVVFCGTTHYEDLAEEGPVANALWEPEKGGNGGQLWTASRANGSRSLRTSVSNVGLKSKSKRLDDNKANRSEDSVDREQELEDGTVWIHQKVLTMS